MIKIIIHVSMFFVATLAAAGGVADGGGGDLMVVEFVAIARALMGESSPINYADRQILESALAKSRIVSVKTLIDPRTHKPVPNQNTLVAWGSPGFIQLKLASGRTNEISWEELRRSGKPIAHYVFHELFRASGEVDESGYSPDEAFQLSVRKYNLDSSSIVSRYSECIEAVRGILYKKFRTDYTTFIDFSQIVVSSNLGGMAGIIGFARVNHSDESGSIKRLWTYSVSATCDDVPGDPTLTRLRDRNLDRKLDFKDIALDLIDFDRQ